MNKENPETVGDRVKIIRRGLGMKQNEFAELLGIRQATVSNLERNARDMSNDILNKLHKLGYPVEWILYGTDPGEFDTDLSFGFFDKTNIPASPLSKEILEIIRMVHDLNPQQLAYVKGVIVGIKNANSC